MAAINRILIMVLIFITTACGYHLRGAYDLPKGMKTIFLEGGSALFREQLVTSLNSSGGKLAESPDKADVILKVYEDDIDRRVLSLSGRGRSNDIELNGHLEYQLRDNKNGILVGRSRWILSANILMTNRTLSPKVTKKQSSKKNCIHKLSGQSLIGVGRH